MAHGPLHKVERQAVTAVGFKVLENKDQCHFFALVLIPVRCRKLVHEVHPSYDAIVIVVDQIGKSDFDI